MSKSSSENGSETTSSGSDEDESVEDPDYEESEASEATKSESVPAAVNGAAETAKTEEAEVEGSGSGSGEDEESGSGEDEESGSGEDEEGGSGEDEDEGEDEESKAESKADVKDEAKKEAVDEEDEASESGSGEAEDEDEESGEDEESDEEGDEEGDDDTVAESPAKKESKAKSVTNEEEGDEASGSGDDEESDEESDEDEDGESNADSKVTSKKESSSVAGEDATESKANSGSDEDEEDEESDEDEEDEDEEGDEDEESEALDEEAKVKKQSTATVGDEENGDEEGEDEDEEGEEGDEDEGEDEDVGEETAAEDESAVGEESEAAGEEVGEVGESMDVEEQAEDEEVVKKKKPKKDPGKKKKKKKKSKKGKENEEPIDEEQEGEEDETKVSKLEEYDLEEMPFVKELQEPRQEPDDRTYVKPPDHDADAKKWRAKKERGQGLSQGGHAENIRLERYEAENRPVKRVVIPCVIPWELAKTKESQSGMQFGGSRDAVSKVQGEMPVDLTAVATIPKLFDKTSLASQAGAASFGKYRENVTVPIGGLEMDVEQQRECNNVIPKQAGSFVNPDAGHAYFGGRRDNVPHVHYQQHMTGSIDHDSHTFLGKLEQGVPGHQAGSNVIDTFRKQTFDIEEGIVEITERHGKRRIRKKRMGNASSLVPKLFDPSHAVTKGDASRTGAGNWGLGKRQVTTAVQGGYELNDEEKIASKKEVPWIMQKQLDSQAGTGGFAKPREPGQNVQVWSGKEKFLHE